VTYLLLEIPLICFDSCRNLNILYTVHQLFHIVEWDISQVDSAFLRVRHDVVAPFYVFELLIFLA